MTADLDKLQGEWYVNTLEIDGAALTPEYFAGAKIVLEGDRLTSLSMGAIYEGTIELDPAKKPKTLKMTFTKGPEIGNTNHGIYELKPKGWKLCLTMKGGPAPATFATAPGSGRALESFSRTAPAVPPKPTAETAPAAGPAPELEGEWAMVSCIRDGHPLDARMVKTGRRIASGGETQVLFGNRLFMQAKFTADRTHTPMTMDYVLTSGQGIGKTQSGIYELEGGSLKLIFTAPEQPRPMDFTTKLGDGRTLTVWKQIKK